MANLWNRGAARTSMMGSRDNTSNPTAAAKMLLGKKRIARGKAKLARFPRRRAFRGNPAPAFIAAAAPTIAEKIGIDLETRGAKDKRAAQEGAQLAQAAIAGDVASLAELERRSKEAATSKRKAIYKAILDGAVRQVQATESRERAARAESRAAGVAASRERREARFLEAGTAIGSAIGQAALRGGRSVRRPGRKRRASRGRAFSF